MCRIRSVIALALAAALASAVGACALGPPYGPYGPYHRYPPGTFERPNGQPKVLPCMIGDALC